MPYLIYCINGPFFQKTSLDLSTFLGSLTSLAADNPHSIILNGPFVPSDNSIIIQGDIRENDESIDYFSFFESLIIKINSIFAQKRTLIILSPSLNDLNNFYPLPQPQFNLSQSKIISNLEIFKTGRVNFQIFFKLLFF